MPLPWIPIVGKSFSPDAFSDYCQTLSWTTWKPSFLVLHNTGEPKLADEPHGFSEASMQGFVRYYRDDQKWHAGPHLFCDDHQIWAFTPLTTPGVHSPSWNKISIGVEMLGNYDSDLFSEGRGLSVRKNAESAIATLCRIFHWPASIIRLHREDPETTHHCPGNNVIKAEVIQEVAALLGNGQG